MKENRSFRRNCDWFTTAADIHFSTRIRSSLTNTTEKSVQYGFRPSTQRAQSIIHGMDYRNK